MTPSASPSLPLISSTALFLKFIDFGRLELAPNSQIGKCVSNELHDSAQAEDVVNVWKGMAQSLGRAQDDVFRDWRYHIRHLVIFPDDLSEVIRLTRARRDQEKVRKTEEARQSQIYRETEVVLVAELKEAKASPETQEGQKAISEIAKRLNENRNLKKSWEESNSQRLQKYREDEASTIRMIAEMKQNLEDRRVQLLRDLVKLMDDPRSSLSERLREFDDTNAEIYVDIATASRDQVQPLHMAIKELRKLATEQLDSTTSENASANLVLDMEKTANASDSLSREQAVLKNLRFASIRDRHGTVVDAHPTTFEWIVKPQSQFIHWLSSCSGTYWVSGKPGSGKSTLMKYTSSHKKTEEALGSWANGHTLVVASFYFWRLGTVMETSLQGLCQSIIFDVLRKCPQLIPVVCHDRWVSGSDTQAAEPWTPKEVEETFLRIMTQEGSNVKICLFIDGLDEFEGDLSHMIELLKRAARSENNKLCLSSRPDNPFPGAFGQNPDRVLRLQDWTHEDIRKYAKDQLEKHSEILRLANEGPGYTDLIATIDSMADGVFLWVFLVVKDLKTGMTNKDSIITLQDRLRKLPPDLEKYFKHILDKVEQEYLEASTKTFQMALEAQHPLPLWVFSVLDEGLDFLLIVKANRARPEMIEMKTDALISQLNARCKGLLEAVNTDSAYRGLLKVQFLHRTVRDFLMTTVVKKRLKLESESFNAHLLVCQGLLLQLKQLHLAPDGSSDQTAYVDTALQDMAYHAHRMEMLGETPTEVLNECVRVVKESWHGKTATGQLSFYSYAVRQDLRLYLQRQFSEHPEIIKETPGEPLLSVALRSANWNLRGERYRYFLHPLMVQLLLKYGAQPNQRSNIPNHLGLGLTVWTGFLWLLQEESYAFERRQCYQVVVMLLRAGASPNVLARGDSLQNLFSSKFSGFESNELGRILQEKQRDIGRPSTSVLTTSVDEHLDEVDVGSEAAENLPETLPIESPHRDTQLQHDVKLEDDATSKPVNVGVDQGKPPRGDSEAESKQFGLWSCLCWCFR